MSRNNRNKKRTAPRSNRRSRKRKSPLAGSFLVEAAVIIGMVALILMIRTSSSAVPTPQTQTTTPQTSSWSIGDIVYSNPLVTDAMKSRLFQSNASASKSPQTVSENRGWTTYDESNTYSESNKSDSAISNAERNAIGPPQYVATSPTPVVQWREAVMEAGNFHRQ